MLRLEDSQDFDLQRCFRHPVLAVPVKTSAFAKAKVAMSLMQHFACCLRFISVSTLGCFTFQADRPENLGRQASPQNNPHSASMILKNDPREDPFQYYKASAQDKCTGSPCCKGSVAIELRCFGLLQACGGHCALAIPASESYK